MPEEDLDKIRLRVANVIINCNLIEKKNERDYISLCKFFSAIFH
jgi:hypothetical protein